MSIYSSAWSTALKKLYKYLGTRNVRLKSRGLATKGKGMGQTRQGTVKKVGGARGWTDPMSVPRASQVMGGGRIFTPSGGGKSKFMTKGSTYRPARGTKIAGAGAGGGSLVAGLAYTQESKGPSGAATAGQRQFKAVTALRNTAHMRTKTPVSKGPAWHSDVASFSKSGYHKFKKGSKSAKQFQQSYDIAKKSGAKVFTWGLTGKKYKV